MSKWFLLCILLGLCILIPYAVSADTYVDITATGSDNGVPDCPTNLEAVATSAHLITLTWTEGANTDNNVVRGKWGSYPANIADGWEVYNGPNDNCTDTQDIGGSEDALYYRVWAWNSSGYAACYASDYVEGGLAGVANAILLIPLVMLCGVLSGFGFWRIRSMWPLLVIAALMWGAMGFWCYTQVNEAWDIWFFVGCVGVLGMLAHIVLGPWKWVTDEPRVEPQKEERLTDRLKNRRWQKYRIM